MHPLPMTFTEENIIVAIKNKSSENPLEKSSNSKKLLLKNPLVQKP